VFGHLYWHEQATHLAAAGYLGRALLLNAYADHLLQDALAPGHIRTPRRKLHDAAALAMHDYYNAAGALYRPRRAGELAALVAGGVPSAVADVFPADPKEREDDIVGWETTGVQMTGDGRIGAPAPDRRRQYALMVLLTARSVADIFDSYEKRTPSTSFNAAPQPWLPYRRAESTGELLTPQSDNGFGGYRSDKSDGALQLKPTLGLVVGQQSFFHSAATPSRWTFGAESLVLWSPGHKWVDAPLALQFGWTLGVMQSRSPTQRVNSVSSRVVLPVPLVDMQGSLIVKHSWCARGPFRTEGFEMGGRLEMGFGFVFVGVGAEMARALDATGGVQKNIAGSATLSVFLPGRLLGL
jgi:hypothetical protein